MKIQIINPNGRIGLKEEAIEPPVWAAFIADVERRKGYEVEIIDAEADKLSPLECSLKCDADIILIVVMGKNPSVSSTPKMPYVIELCGLLKGKDVWLTGLHPQALPEQTEKETGFPVLPYNPEHFRIPSWDLIDFNKYRAHNWHTLGYDKRSPYGVIITSFGCPYNCYYCNIHTLYPSRKVTYRPISDIAEELEYMAKKGIKHLRIWDELFTLDKNRVSEVCSILKGHEFNVWAYGRVDTVTPEMMETLKAAGINWIAYGLDDKHSDIDIYRGVQMAHNAGIHVIGNFLLTEQNDDVLENAESIDLEWANFYVCLPYPGSQWYKDAGIINDWNWYNQYHRDDTLTRKRNEDFRHFFSRPEYHKYINRKIGEKAVLQIKEMLSGNH